MSRFYQAIVREQQAAAAEKRLREQESRGIKNPERVKFKQREQQKRDKEVDKAAQMGTSSGLKVQQNNLHLHISVDYLIHSFVLNSKLLGLLEVGLS